MFTTHVFSSNTRDNHSTCIHIFNALNEKVVDCEGMGDDDLENLNQRFGK